jgi:hypothetical protein
MGSSNFRTPRSAAQSRAPTPPASGSQNYVRGFFGNHVDRAGDKEAGDARENRGVDDPQSRGAMHAEVAADHGAAIPRPDRASARGVGAPGPDTDEIPKFVIALERVARLLLGRDQAAVFDFFRQFADKADAGDDRIQILPGDIAASSK